MRTYLIYTLVLLLSYCSNTWSQCNNDVTPPVAICQDIVQYLDATGVVVVAATALDSGSIDNCGIASYQINQQAQYAFTTANIGLNTAMFTVVDTAGNVDTCMALVLIVDTIAPVAFCRTATVYLDSNGTFPLSPSLVDGGSFDGGGSIIRHINGQQNVLLLSTADVGTSAVVLTVTDMSGNSSSCVATVTVIDTFSTIVATTFLDPLAIELTVFPNPAREQITITTTEALLEHVQWTTITGQIVLERVLNGERQAYFSVEQLPKGLYLVTVLTNKGRISKKVLVE